MSAGGDRSLRTPHGSPGPADRASSQRLEAPPAGAGSGPDDGFDSDLGHDGPGSGHGRGHNPGPASLRDNLATAYHDRRRIGAALLIGLALTALVALAMPKRYTAEASLLLRLGREYTYTPEVGDPATAQPVSYDREQTLQAEAKILTSRDVIESAVGHVGVNALYPALVKDAAAPQAALPQAVLAVERALDAELLKNSNLLEVSFRHADPQLASAFLQQLIDAYLQKRSAVFSSADQGAAAEDFAARGAELRVAEARMAAYKSTHAIRSFAEEQSLLLAQRNALEQRQTDVELALAQAGGRTSALRNQLARIPSEVTLSSETQRGEAAESARKLLLDLRLKERDARSKFFDTEAPVQDVRADTESATAYLRELEATPPRSVRTGRSAVRDGAETDLLHATADQGQARAGTSTLAAQLAAIDKRLADLADSENELRQLERVRRLSEVSYDAAAKRLRDETALAALDRQRKSNISVVQKPMVPLEARSGRGVVVVLGVLLSLGAALLTAFASALWRDTFLTPEQAERGLDLPLLGSITLATR